MTNQIDPQYPHLPLPKPWATRFFFITCALYVAYAVILLPLSEYVGSNIIFQGTFLYEIISFLCTAVDLAAFCWTFASLICARFSRGISAAFKNLWIFVGASAVRYVLTFFVSWRMEGMSGSDILFELLFSAIYILLDVTQAAIVLVFAHMLRKQADAMYVVRAKALRVLDEPAPDPLAQERTCRSIFTMQGSLHTATLLAAALVAFVRVVGRMIYDIGYGAPTDGVDLAWMIFSYLADIALAVLCCALIRILCIRLLFPKSKMK